jgi:phenylpyruvate tautomerase PptA (4-oxalocrotonate tautomerase family)
MPIIDITLIGEAPGAPALTAELAQAIGDALRADAATVWVTLTRRAAGEYAENGPPPSPPPVFVRVLALGDDGPSRAARARAIGAAVAATIGHPAERVHVIFEPDAAGRVFFGGRGRQG